MEMPSPSDFERRIMLCGVYVYKTACALDTGFYHSTVQLTQYYLKGVFDVFYKDSAVPFVDISPLLSPHSGTALLVRKQAVRCSL